MNVRYETNDGCSYSSWSGTLEIFEGTIDGNGCGTSSCGTKVYCEYNEADQAKVYVAPRDGRVIIVADGSYASDDEGDYRLTVKLTCGAGGCGC